MASARETEDDVAESGRRAAWLSRGLEALVRDFADLDADDVDCGDSDKPPAEPGPPHFDVVIVGSGYGGAVAAYELARIDESSRPRVCILERGSEYLSGAFPSRMADLAGHVRFAAPDNTVARGTLEGLFDVRVGPDVNALVANGLGGGSLINAGVMEMPHPSVFRESRWPAAIRGDSTLVDQARSLQALMGAGRVGAKTEKFRRLKSLHPDGFRQILASVAATETVNSANAELDGCIACGDCATGCNHNAKDSLDLNLLRIAHEAKMPIYTGATVLGLERGAGGSGWVVIVNHTERHLRKRQQRAFRLRASHVILAAGTFGSTEILMRSRTSTLRFSPQLGKKFSANGDTIFVLNDTAKPVNGVARESDPPAQRAVGPTISGMIDLRCGDPQSDVVIQDLGIPGSLRLLFQEAVATTDALNKLLIPDPACHAPDEPFTDSAAIDDAQTGRSLAVAMIGRDSADGVLERRHDRFDPLGDGVLTVRWPSLRNDPRFAAYHALLAKLLRESPLHQVGARALQNPVWRPLSSELEDVFGAQRGPMLTVHPLGGCPMGENANEGVVDDRGRVFDAATTGDGLPAVHPGLLVLDGSIIPTSIGINPSLTIAVLAQRAMRMREWLKDLPETPQPDVRPTRMRRPVFALTRPQTPRPTKVQVTEQLCGRLRLDGDPWGHPGHGAELTLTYAPREVAELMSTTAEKRCLHVGDGSGFLRIFSLKQGSKPDEWRHDKLEIEAPVTGDLKIFRHGRSRPGWRAARAMTVWFLHRGFRDVVQNLYDKLRRWLGALPRLDEPEQSVWDYLKKLHKLADHAGSVRLLEYDLTIGPDVAGGPQTPPLPGFANAKITARKHLRYAVGANPWRQLQELTLIEFPRLERKFFCKPATLDLNLDYLVSKSVPLLRVVAQQDRPTALLDLGRFALYLFRVVLQVHALSFRRPDPRTDREPSRLPGAIVGRLPSPEIEWRVVGHKPDGKAVCTRLARYRDRACIAKKSAEGENPVLLIHGYSASGTTYAHPAVQGNLAETLCNAGRDVWIIDLRSSAGLLDTATEGWAFEDMAEIDIPDAICHILAVTGSGKIDVVAHCMGSAMFSMAVLGRKEDKLSRHIGRVVLSQIGPVMKLTTANMFRAYLMRWIRHFLPLADYSFRPAKKKLGLGGNFLDRILATLPYPRSEYRLENPLWPPGVALPWATSRHRMDALYAQTFSLANMSVDVLDHIDDFFGPLSVETVSQVIHFARTQTVTDRTGFNDYVTPFRLQSRFTFPVLYLHGRDNGLSDAATLDLMHDAFSGAGIAHLPNEHLKSADAVLRAISAQRSHLASGAASLMTWCIEGHGHQDVLIGTQAKQVAGVIERFLER